MVVESEINKAAYLLAGNNTLTNLSLSNKWNILDQGIAYLADNKTLTSLTLSVKIRSRPGITSLLQNTVLTELKLNNVSTSAEEGDEIALILSKHRTLTKLEFYDCEINPNGISSLLNNRVLKIFSFTNIHDIPINSITRILSTHPTITELNLTQCQINAEKAAFFLANKILKKLHLEDEDLDDECARILSQHTHLTNLSLLSGEITNKGIAFFMKSNTLTHFSYKRCRALFDNQNINDESARALSAHPTITDLELQNCNISSKGAEFFRENKIIKTLRLGWNPLGDEGAFILSTLPLSILDLNNCGIGDKGVIALAGNPQLADLTLGSTDPNDKIGLLGMIALAFNQTLTHLSLQYSDIPLLGWYFLLGNQTLRDITLHNIKFRKEINDKNIILGLNQLGIRNSQFQSQYDAAVQQYLSELMPKVLVKEIQDYSKGAYPYRYQLFHNHLTPAYKDAIQQALPELKKHFSDIEQVCQI